MLDDDRAGLVVADCREALKEFPEAFFDAVVCDPPYELSFMGRAWDATGVAYDPATWAACLRVLKPGGHLLAFSGTRTYHGMACAIEKAGFEIRDMIDWLYGTGFPKSLNLPGGIGTALKPGHEPVCMARKPFDGTVAANAELYGTGGLAIDACRIGSELVGWGGGAAGGATWTAENCGLAKPGAPRPAVGRWPANVCLDEDAAAELDAQTSSLKQGGRLTGEEPGSRDGQVAFGKLGARRAWEPYADSGGASRFFYCAKASRAEREEGCEGLPPRAGFQAVEREEGSAGIQNPRAGAGRTAKEVRNWHPTVKPISLMRWLCRLVTQPGGIVLDPFAGSGSTGVAAVKEGLRFVGIEMDLGHAAIAEARILHALRNLPAAGASKG